MRVQLQIVAGGRAFDLTPWADSAQWSFGPSGCRDLEVAAPRRLMAAVALFALQGVAEVTASRGPRILWRGRLNTANLALGDAGTMIRLRAQGYAAALRDIRHTALWSDTRLERWENNPGSYASTLLDESPQFTSDTNNRLYLSPEKNSVVPQFGGYIWTYDIPDRSTRAITNVSFDYSMLLPAGWRLTVRNKQGNGWLTDTTNIDGTGALVSGSVSTVQPAGTTRLNLMMFWNSGGSVTTSVETGDHFVTITNVRVKTTTGAVTTGAIAAALLSEVRAVNPSQLDPTTVLIQDPGIDLTDVLYEDAYALNVLQALAKKGNGAGAIYAAGVDEHRRLYLRPVGSGGRRWFVAARSLEVERPRDSVANRVYARYQQADNRTLRTTSASDASSIAVYGLTRDGVVDADTTALSLAQQLRDTSLRDTADPRPAASVEVERVTNEAGAIVLGDEIRPGDIVAIQYIRAAPGSGIDRIRTFRVGECGYDVSQPGRPTISPEEPLPSLDVLLAQQGRSIEL
jgi:hypothetical protein